MTIDRIVETVTEPAPGGETPVTDAECGQWDGDPYVDVVTASFARTLELQRNALQRERDVWKQQAKLSAEDYVAAYRRESDAESELQKVREHRDSNLQSLKRVEAELAAAKRENEELKQSVADATSGSVNASKVAWTAVRDESRKLLAERERAYTAGRDLAEVNKRLDVASAELPPIRYSYMSMSAESTGFYAAQEQVDALREKATSIIARLQGENEALRVDAEKWRKSEAFFADAARPKEPK